MSITAFLIRTLPLQYMLFFPAPDILSQENSDWIRLGGPPGGLGYDIRYNPDSPDIWYVTDANAGVHRSVDNGYRWEAVNEGIATNTGPTNDLIPVFCLTVNPHDPMIVWAGTTGTGHLYRSVDAGVTWEERNEGITLDYDMLSFRGITFDPVSPDIIYAMAETTDESLGGPGVWGTGTGGVIYKSLDGGEQWEKIWDGGVPSSLTRYMWINPENTDILYVSTGIFDRGAVGEGDYFTDPFGGIGILKSIDGGYTWTVQDESNGLRCLYLGSLYMHPLHPDTLLTCAGHVLTDGRGVEYLENIVSSGGTTPFGVYRTIDGGLHWTQVLANGTGEVFASVEYSTSDPDIAYAASSAAVYKSEDAGETWIKVSSGETNWGPPGVVTGFPIDIQCDPRDPNRLFINNYGGGNYLSEDGGQNWINASNGCTGSRPRKVEVSPFDPAIIYAVAPSGIWLSKDAGRTWNGIHFPPDNAPVLPDYSSLLADKDLKGHIYAGTRASHILESFDGGMKWDFLWPGFDEFGEIIGYDVEVSDLVSAPSDPDMLYAGLSMPGCSYSAEPCGTGMGVAYSYDGGDRWEISGDPLIRDLAVISLAVNPGDPLKIYAGTENGLFLSEDGAVTWTRVSSLPVNGRTRAVAMNPSMAEQIFVGIDGYGMYVSDDEGLSWAPLATGLQPNSSFRDIVFNPTDNMTMYVCDLFSGVYRSEDGGDTWSIMNEGFFNRAVTDLSVSLDGLHMYASTYGNGVYRMDFNGKPPVYPTSSWPGRENNGTAVELFPNPVSDILHLRTTEEIERIEIYNTTGILVYACTDCTYMNLSHFPPGCYHAIIRFKKEKPGFHRMIVKQ